MQEQMQAKTPIQTKSEELRSSITVMNLNYSVAVDTDENGKILSERFVIRRISKANVVSTITLDHTNSNVSVEINNGFVAHWNVILVPSAHDERIANILQWTKTPFLLPMSIIEEFANEAKQSLETTKEKHNYVIKQTALCQSYIDAFEQPVKDTYSELKLEMIAHSEKFKKAPSEDQPLFNPNQLFVAVLGYLIEHHKYDYEIFFSDRLSSTDEVDLWEEQIADLEKEQTKLQSRLSRLSWIKFDILLEYPIRDMYNTIQYMIKLFDNTNSYYIRANLEKFVSDASKIAQHRGLITDNQAEKFFEKILVKTEDKWQRNYRIFHDDSRLQEGLDRAIRAGAIHPNEVPVCPSGRQRNFLKKKINDFLELHDGISLYEKVNKISPKLQDDARDKAERLVKAEHDKVQKILSDTKAKPTATKTTEQTADDLERTNRTLAKLARFNIR